MEANSAADGRALVGIDVGGTHTDIVVVARDGRLLYAEKVPSEPRAPTRAIRGALAAVPAGVPIGLCINGTTVAVNAVLQSAFPRAGLVTTRGFRDLLYIRRETKANIYDLDWRKPKPVITRQLTFEVDERLDADGNVVVPLGDLQPLLDWLEREDLNDVAVCLLHAYRNPAHERAIQEAIVASRPDARVTLSSEVWPEWREFERTYNTALNAVLKPIIEEYLAGLVEAVRNAAGHDDVYVMHADGGVLRPEEIARRPVLTLLSGTTAGALLGARLASEARTPMAVSLDMGGTSTDIGLAENGRPRRSAELFLEWEGTLGFAGVDVVSIGAGGGSIVWADEAGVLHVGPRSAGADPGPAAFNRGGTEPTLTDAYLLLGYLGDDPLIAGRILDDSRARESFDKLLDRTGLSPGALYGAVYEIATANLAAGIRRVTVERGVDPRACQLMCFGGAGPLHAAALVRHLGLASALVPPRPGNGSALGLLLAPVKHTASQTFYAALRDLPTAGWAAQVRNLRARALDGVPGDIRGHARVEWQLYLRYRGQTRDLSVAADEETIEEFADETRAAVERCFHERHEQEFTFRAEDDPIQLVTMRCEATLPDPELTVRLTRRDDAPATRSERAVAASFLNGEGAYVRAEATAVTRDALRPGDAVAGPAIMLDHGATTLLPPGANGRVDERGNIIVSWEV